MAGAERGDALRQIQRLFTDGTVAGLPDADLLGRFAAGRDDDAFAALIARHGPMVRAVCRSLLRDPRDAEDAFQATFFALARQAGSLWVGDSLGGWLHRVAYRVAKRAGGAAARRRVKELLCPDAVEAAAAPDGGACGVLPAELHEEIDRLPGACRAAVIICYLEGMTPAEAAWELKCSEATLRRRLAGARGRLRRRLSPAVGSLATTATRPAPVPAEWAVAAARAATAADSGRGVTAAVLALADAALGTLRLARRIRMLRILMALLAAGGGLSAAWALGWPRADGPPAARPALVKVPKAAATVIQVKEGPPDDSADPLPRGALARLGPTRPGRFRHGRDIHRAFFSPDGRVIVTTGWGTVRLWDPTSGKELSHFETRDTFTGGGHQDRDHDLTMDFAPDGRTLAVTEVDGDATRILLRNVATGRIVRRSVDLGAKAYSLAYSPTGEGLVVSFQRAEKAGKPTKEVTVAVYDPDTLKERRRFVADEMQRDQPFTFLPDGRTVALPDGNITDLTDRPDLRLWDIVTGRQSRRIRLPRYDTSSVPLITSDGKTLALGLGDEILLMDLESGREIRRIKVRTYERRSWTMALSPDGRTLATPSEDTGEGDREQKQTGTEHGTGSIPISLWDVATGREVRRLKGHPRLFAGFGRSNLERYTHFGFLQRINSLCFSADGRTLASASDEEIVRLWDVSSGEEVFPGRAHADAVGPLLFTPDGGTLVAGGMDGSLRFCDPRTGAVRGRLAAHATRVASMAVTADGTTLVTASENGPARVWDVATGRKLRELKIPTDFGFSGLELSVDGRTLLTGIPAARLADPQTGRERARLAPHDWKGAEWPWCQRIAPGGQTVFAAYGGSLVECDAASGQELRRLTPSADGKPCCGFLALALSPDGRWLAHGGFQHLHLRDRASLREVATLLVSAPVIDSYNSEIQFSADGRLLAAIVGDSPCCWEVASCRPVLAPDPRNRPTQGAFNHGSPYRQVLSPDGRLLVSYLPGDTAVIWDVASLLKGAEGAARAGADDPEALWADLASEDAGTAYRAVFALADDPARALPLLAERLAPAAAPDPARLAACIADLGSPNFATRESATEALEELGELAAPALREAMSAGPGTESRGRIEALIASSIGPVRSPETLRRLRAITVLDRAGTPEARRHLERLASGAPGARETADAKASLARLAAARRPGTSGGPDGRSSWIRGR